MTPLASIKRLLRPKSIAVIGGRFAAAVIKQCDLIGFEGDIWPVNPKRAEMGGRPCYPDIASLPAGPDASFIAVPTEDTIASIEALAERGAGGAVCYASGFAEIGGDGIALQARLQAAMGDLAVVGPNCYGVLNYLDGVTLWPDEQGGKRLDKGVAIIAQSGNISISLSMQQRSVPLAYVISTGNQAGITIAEYIEALLEDERVTAIGIHLEGLSDVVAFSQAAHKALKKRVPIVVIKSGASDLGQQLTLSHTSSLAGADSLYDALFERFGVLRVKTLPEFMEALKFLSVVGPLPNTQIASISSSGGEAALIADMVERLGLSLPALTPAQLEPLAEVLGERVALANPLDYHTYIWGDETAQYNCFEAMMRGPQSVTLKILDYPRPDICDPTTWVNTGKAFVKAAQARQMSAAVVATLQENLPDDVSEALLEEGIAPMLGLEETLIAIRGAAAIYAKQQQTDTIQPLASPQMNRGEPHTLDEIESKSLLKTYGLPVPTATECTANNAVEVAQQIDFPVVIKVLSEDIVHKSDVGGVQLGINSPEAVEQATKKMASLSDRFLIEQMAPKPITELILGITRDSQFGLALVIGAGGILVELFQDSKTLLFPISRTEVETAIDGLKIAPLLNGYRGQPPADKAAIIEAVLNLARFAEDHAADLIEVDINPLFVLPDGVLAVDAVVRRL